MITAFALVLSATGPSFDCAKAATDVEEMICSDEALAAADRAVAKLYASITPPEKKALFGKQADWLANRDRCADKTCIVASYEDRLIDLWIGSGGLRTRDYQGRGNPDRTLSILDLGNGWSAFFAQAIWTGSTEGAVHNTEAAGVFRLVKGHASRAPTADYDCGWRIQLLSRGRWKLEDWTYEQNEGQCGAVNASVAGVYSP